MSIKDEPTHKEFTTESVADILEVLKRHPGLSIFRGQSYGNWELTPRLYRLFGNADAPDTWPSLESSIIDRFRQYSVPYLEREPKNDFEWLATGQHYGLPTRLLDWTSNPLKAAFFATVENPDDNGVLYGMEPKVWIPMIGEKKEMPDNGLFWVIYPNAIDVRITAQESVLAVFPMSDSRKDVPPLGDRPEYRGAYWSLVKMIIPSAVKADLQDELNVLGVNKSTLFPGLAGLSEHISWKITKPFV